MIAVADITRAGAEYELLASPLKSRFTWEGLLSDRCVQNETEHHPQKPCLPPT